MYLYSFSCKIFFSIYFEYLNVVCSIMISIVENFALQLVFVLSFVKLFLVEVVFIHIFFYYLKICTSNIISLHFFGEI